MFPAGRPRLRRPPHEKASAAVAERFEAAPTATPLRWQGGDLLSNGKGLVVTTTRSINANIERGHDAGTAARFLNCHGGAEQVIVLEHLEGEPTGHLDMFACFAMPYRRPAAGTRAVLRAAEAGTLRGMGRALTVRLLAGRLGEAT